MPLAERVRTPERMDDPRLDPAEHRAALRGLRRLNRLSASVRILWGPIRHAARAADAHSPLRVLDLASGGGDLPIGLAQRARHAGLPIDITGCDLSPTAVGIARDAAARSGVDVRFFELDVLEDELPDGYDVLTCSLFFHHLADADARDLLVRMARAARRLVLVNDLRRTRLGLLMGAVVPRFVTRSAVVYADAVASYRAAFTMPEMRRLAHEAGLHGATVAPRWGERFLLTWSKPPYAEPQP